MSVTLIDFQPGQCRYMVEDAPVPRRRGATPAPGPYCCGAPVDGATSYCAYHRSRVYQRGTALPPRPPKCDRTTAAAPREEREPDLCEVLG